MRGTTPDAYRQFRPSFPTELRLTLGSLRRGHADRTMALRADGFWRATRTPQGPGTLRVTVGSGLGELTASAWGPGASWLVEQATTLVGGRDDPSEFRPTHPLVRELDRRFPGMRIPRTEAVWESLFPTVLEQKVTGLEAHRSYSALLRAFGEPAPMPPGGPRLVLPPAAATVAGTPAHVFHGAAVERKRGDTIRAAAGYAHRLDELPAFPIDEAYRRLTALPGVGDWTAAVVALEALGDADAVAVGDYHLKNLVSWALAGEPRGTDERMLELLEPFRGHRGRVIRLLAAGGFGAPRYGPRLTIHERVR